MHAVWTLSALLCAATIAGCSSSGDNSESSDKDKTSEVIGIDPLSYKCEYLVTLSEVQQAVGGEVAVHQVAFEPPAGTPEPCHYLRKTEDGKRDAWSFDLDCRPNALNDADRLFEQYKVSKMNDAGVVTNESSELSIGRKAMDHHGQALIFVDDNTDCFVRVMGPVAEGRAALGKVLSKKLVQKNTPMRPRAR